MPIKRGITIGFENEIDIFKNSFVVVDFNHIPAYFYDKENQKYLSENGVWRECAGVVFETIQKEILWEFIEHLNLWHKMQFKPEIYGEKKDCLRLLKKTTDGLIANILTKEKHNCNIYDDKIINNAENAFNLFIKKYETTENK